MGEELKRTYTIRIPDPVAARIEEAARTHGITPTTLIQSLILRKFKSSESTDRQPDFASEIALAAKLATLRNNVERLEQSDRSQFDQLRFEIVKPALRSCTP